VGSSRQDHPKAIEALKRLNRPYRLPPLVFQTTEEWQDSDLGLHPIQVALQMQFRNWMERLSIIMSGRDGASGKAIALQDQVKLAQRAGWANLRLKPNFRRKLRCFP